MDPYWIKAIIGSIICIGAGLILGYLLAREK